jgi:DinB superfamily
MTTNEVLVKMVLDRWIALIKNCDSVLNTVSDEQLQKEIVPGKNRGIYLLGHLVAIHDEMLSLLDIGEKEHAELFEIFVKAPDMSITEIPSDHKLRTIWKKQAASLTAQLEQIPANEWFEKHAAVSKEDFINEPHRNKLNILLTRTTHLAYHAGQLVLLK